MSVKRMCLFLAFFSLCLARQLFPQEISAENESEHERTSERTAETAQSLSEDTVYVIAEINYHITGITHSWALAYAAEIKRGELINGTKEFETYIERKNQELKNQRVLAEENTYLEYSFGPAGDDGTVPVTLEIYTKDTWNIIALPYPKYDSNSGFTFNIRARDYNFAGTMQPLRLDLGYRYDENERHHFDFALDLDFPFNFLEYRWNFNFYNQLKLGPDEPAQFKNTTGISVEVPWKTTTFTFGVNQITFINEENNDDDKALLNTDYYNGWYMQSEGYVFWRIPFGLKSEYGELAYTPGFKVYSKYKPLEELTYYRRGAALVGSHSLGFGHIDWIGNFRRGFSVSADNSNEYNTYRHAWSRTAGFLTVVHLLPVDWMGISFRFMYRHWFDGLSDAGDALRGILDSKLSAQKMLSVNIDFPFRILRFLPSKWFNKPKLRFMEFEMHASPFADLAMFEGTDKSWNRNVNFTFGNLYVTGGLEIIVFPLAWRSFYIRASAGGDFMHFLQERSFSFRREYFVGIGHFF